MIYLRTANLSPAIFFASHFDNLLDHFYRHRSSWTTSATVGIALIGVGGALGFDLGMVAEQLFLELILQIISYVGYNQPCLQWPVPICLRTSDT
jgi:hypothetical protein